MRGLFALAGRLPQTTRVGLLYLGIRAALFVTALGIGIIAGLHGPVLVFAAFLVSGVAGYPLARRQREHLAAAAEHRLRRR